MLSTAIDAVIVAPSAATRTLSIAPAASRTPTSAPLGAATSIRRPPAGSASASAAIATAGGAPLHATAWPARCSAPSQSAMYGSGAVGKSACSATAEGKRVHPASRVPMSRELARSTERSPAGTRLAPMSHPSTANAAMRQPSSSRLRRERIHDEVHGKPRVVHRHEPLGVRMVVPLRAVVLVAVQHTDAIAPPAHDGEQVLVHQVVAPAIELVTRR